MKPLAERVTLAATGLGRAEGLVEFSEALDTILKELGSADFTRSRDELINFRRALESLARRVARLGAVVRPRLAVIIGEVSDAG